MNDTDRLLARLRGYLEAALGRDRNDDWTRARTRARKAYNAAPNGLEVSGMSDYTSEDVAETVDAALPSLMRVFASGEETVDLINVDQGMAELASAYVDHMIWAENRGFSVIQDWLKGGMLDRIGFVKVRVDTTKSSRIVEWSAASGESRPEGMVLEETEDGSFARIRVVTSSPEKMFIEFVNSDEILIDPGATGLETGKFRFLAHRQAKTRAALRAMGYAVSDDEALGSPDPEDPTGLRQLRQPDYDETDEESDPVTYYEAYVYDDLTGDGIEELWKVCFLNDAQEERVLHLDMIERAPFAAWSPIAMPGQLMGRSLAETAISVQHVKTSTVRGMLDNLELLNNPRRQVVPEMVNLDDVLNPMVGQLMRVREIGMIQPEPVPPVMAAALQAIQMFDGIRESRSGVRRFVSSMDGRSLDAYARTLGGAEMVDNASNDRLDLMARNFAEVGLRNLCDLIIHIGRQAGLVRRVEVAGQTVDFDPSTIPAEAMFKARLGLGVSSKQSQLQRVGALQATIEKVLAAQMGLGVEMVGPEQVYAVALASVKALGFDNSARFLSAPKSLPATQAADPNAAEMAKLQQQQAIEMAKLEMQASLKREQMDMEFRLKREQMAIEAELALARGSSSAGSAIRPGGAIG